MDERERIGHKVPNVRKRIDCYVMRMGLWCYDRRLGGEGGKGGGEVRALMGRVLR